jgi:hypothetical protein
MAIIIIIRYISAFLSNQLRIFCEKALSPMQTEGGHQSHLNNFRPKVISKFSDVRTIAKYRRCYPRNGRRSMHLPISSKNQQHPTQPQQHSIDLTLWGSNVRISRWRVRRRTWDKTASTWLSNQHPSHTTTSLQLTHLIPLPTLLFRRRITRTKRLLPTLRHAS